MADTVSVGGVGEWRRAARGDDALMARELTAEEIIEGQIQETAEKVLCAICANSAARQYVDDLIRTAFEIAQSYHAICERRYQEARKAGIEGQG